MIQEQKKLRLLQPDTAGNWIYADIDGERVFATQVYLACESDGSEWHECTDAERVEYMTGLPNDE